MIKSVFFALAVAAAASSATTAHAVTKAEREACRPDAQRLCSTHIGNPKAVRACLSESKDSLSEACRKVIEAHGG